MFQNSLHKRFKDLRYSLGSHLQVVEVLLLIWVLNQYLNIILQKRLLSLFSYHRELCSFHFVVPQNEIKGSTLVTLAE